MVGQIVIIDEHAEKGLRRFSEEVQESFGFVVDILRDKGVLKFPHAKKITKKIFEIRIKLEGEYRGLYAYLKGDSIVVLPVFRKKTQKTPIKSIKLAERRLINYENT